ncbi:NAD(P)H-hydrate dehydratase [Shimia sp. R10_1]|uniref:NAD(P)H-hydrate dehydratase n=1 Tax=Shimia sp. R10_1 TaxID=2821095 RepID=UPI001AD9676B|nr:NAD(P)H-hydrate dehydratase [Shimia sp. R10_1]MBO9472397.1 NAD(P)H-hydrate dehydratase [Shimia sp. R10_1]
MSEILTAAQMRAIERTAIESGDVTGLELMERAGQGVVEAFFERWPALGDAGALQDKPLREDGLEGGQPPNAAFDGGQPPCPRDTSGKRKRAVVLCGPGNNGGDGFVVARLLHQLGWELDVFLYGDAEKLPPDARVNYERWCDLGTVTARAINPPPLVDDSLHIKGQCDLVVDALFGTGLSRPFQSVFSFFADPHLRSIMAERGCKVVAVDVPTGLCSDSGAVLGSCIAADLTVSFHRKKLGHVLKDGPAFCEAVTVKDIGLLERHSQVVPAEKPVREASVAFDYLNKEAPHHKFSHGHALILSGEAGKTGAARLSARAALRIGAGLVTLGVPPAAQQEVACQITALMLQRVADAEGFAEVLKDSRINALCLGPGLGQERARALVPVALKTKRATVLDADALSAFAEEPERLFEILHERVVLTPHAGEFARLFPDIAERLAAPPIKGPACSKVDATREAAVRAGCTVLFKGPDTVIASPNGMCSVNAAVYERSAPWLATAGSGDVLAGFITGLLARGLAPQQATEMAAWLHVECARAFGPGLIAEDLPETLPQVLRGLIAEGGSGR